MKGKEFTRGRNGFNFNLLTFLTYVDINTVVMWLFFFRKLLKLPAYRFHFMPLGLQSKLSYPSRFFFKRFWYMSFLFIFQAVHSSALSKRAQPGQTNGCSSHHLLNNPRSLDVGMESERFRLFRVLVSDDFPWTRRLYSTDAEAEGIFSDIEKHPTRTIQ